MKLYILSVLAYVGCVMSLTITDPTGTTPPPCTVPDGFCTGRENGNYNHPSLPNRFISCSEGMGYCQACFPLSLFFKQSCNQCVYDLDDDCYTTETWEPHTTYECPPGDCEARGDKTLNKNIEDPRQEHHYIGCWEGMTRGCVVCPAYLKFNEPCNACMYRGLYYTQDEIYQSKVIRNTENNLCLSAQSDSVAEFVNCDLTSTDNNNKRSKFFFDKTGGKIQNVYYHKCLKNSNVNNTYVLGDCDTAPEFVLSDEHILTGDECVAGGSILNGMPHVADVCYDMFEVIAGEQ